MTHPVGLNALFGIYAVHLAVELADEFLDRLGRALAGVLLAAEVVARGAGFPRPAEIKTAIDLLRPLPPVLLQPRAKARLGNCICQDDDYIEA